MADENISLVVNMRKNKNQKADGYQKYFPELARRNTLSTRGLAEHIAHHGTLYTLDVVDGVLRKISNCVPELVAQGVAVKIEGLGTFYPTAECVKGGTAEADLAGLQPADVVKGIHVRFWPDATKLDNLTSRVFREKCQMVMGNVVETAEITVAGQKTTVRKSMPIADFVKDLHKDANNG